MRKKRFHCSFANYSFFAIYGRFCKIGAFPLGVFSIRDFNLHNLKGNGNAPIDITKWAQEYFQKPLSVNTIRRAICRCQLKLYHEKRKTYVNMVQKCRRVLWAKAHLKWTVSNWKSVLWSDKSKFDILVGNHGRRVLRAKEEGDLPACYQRSVQKPVSLMVWGCIRAYGSLHVLEGTMNAERWYLFQQDTAKPHTAAITTAWLHSRRAELACLQSRSFTNREHLVHH